MGLEWCQVENNLQAQNTGSPKKFPCITSFHFEWSYVGKPVWIFPILSLFSCCGALYCLGNIPGVAAVLHKAICSRIHLWCCVFPPFQAVVLAAMVEAPTAVQTTAPLRVRVLATSGLERPLVDSLATCLAVAPTPTSNPMAMETLAMAGAGAVAGVEWAPGGVVDGHLLVEVDVLHLVADLVAVPLAVAALELELHLVSINFCHAELNWENIKLF